MKSSIATNNGTVTIEEFIFENGKLGVLKLLVHSLKMRNST